MGQSLDVLAQVSSVEPLDRLDDPRVERPPTIGEEASVRHLVRERVLESVLDLGEGVRWILVRDLEESQHRRQERFEGAVEGQEPARHLLADEPGVVAALDPEVGAQQFDHREV